MINLKANCKAAGEVIYKCLAEGKVKAGWFKSFISKVENVCVNFTNKSSYRTHEIFITSPFESRSHTRVFNHNPPLKLNNYISDGIIKLDRNYFLKNKITYVSSRDCSKVIYDLSPKKSDDREHISDNGFAKFYVRKDWDYTPEHAWD